MCVRRCIAKSIQVVQGGWIFSYQFIDTSFLVRFALNRNRKTTHEWVAKREIKELFRCLNFNRNFFYWLCAQDWTYFIDCKNRQWCMAVCPSTWLSLADRIQNHKYAQYPQKFSLCLLLLRLNKSHNTIKRPVVRLSGIIKYKCS